MSPYALFPDATTRFPRRLRRRCSSTDAGHLKAWRICCDSWIKTASQVDLPKYFRGIQRTIHHMGLN